MRRTPSGLNVPNVNCGALSSPPPCGWLVGGGTLGGGTPLLGFMVPRASVFVGSGRGGFGFDGVSRRVGAARVGRASRRSRLDGGVRATDASPLLGFYRRGIRAVDAPAACVTPRAWSREVGPGPPRLRVRESGSGKRQNARPGAERARGRRFAPRVTSRREAIGKWRQRRPTPVFVGGLGKSQSPFVRFVPDAPSAGDRFASVAASEAAPDSVGCGRASASVERRRRVRDGRRDVSGLRENGLRHSRRITHASGATSVRPFRSEKSIKRGLCAMLVSADGLRVMRCDPAATVPGAFVRRRIEKRQSSQRWRAARVGFSFFATPETNLCRRRAAASSATQRGTPPRPRLCTSLPPRSLTSSCPPPQPRRAASRARRRLAPRMPPAAPPTRRSAVRARALGPAPPRSRARRRAAAASLRARRRRPTPRFPTPSSTAPRRR
jgi:hypothetical protein